MGFDYVRYLRSKRTVDDRAINSNVLRRFKELISVEHAGAARFEAAPLRIVEVGAGVGAMPLRLLQAGVFDG